MTVQDWLGEYQLGIDIWNNKYRYNDENFDEWLDRVSGENEDLRQLIKDKKFLFGGRTLANRNTGKKGSFSNCYSRGFVEDDLNDLMQANTDIAKTFKAQGGQGISLSKLRPKGCGINNGQFKSDGIIPFMEIYNRTTESISQGGSRKGALIMTLDAWHKEAEDFIKIKSEDGKIQKANLSLEIDDEFMEYVDHYYKTGEKLTKHIEKKYNGNTIEYEVVPIDLYKLMMEKAYDWAEPGVIYVNRFRNYNLMEFVDDYKIETCNPCGEQPLPKHGACNLGSINLSEFVDDPFTKHASFNESDFKEAVDISVKALDDVLDENMDNHALLEQKEMAYNYRNIGLGIMGLHDCLIKLGITYGSEESKEFIDNIMSVMFKEAVLASSYLAKEKGVFPKYDKSILASEIIRSHFTEEELNDLGITKSGLRNCSLLSIAPSGSIGTMLNISTGCEPLFQISYKRKTESLNNGKETFYNVYSGIVSEYIKKYKTTDLPEYFNTSANIKWRDRIDIQSYLQNHVDTAISSTVNLPFESTLDEIEELYLYAWKKGLKGVTIFRDGSKRLGILTTNNKTEKKAKSNSELQYNYIKPISRKTIGVTSGKTYCKKCACGTLYITINCDNDNNVVETFIHTSKGGICQANIGAITRMISVGLRSGVKVEEIIDQLKGITCPACVKLIGKGESLDGISCPDILGKTILDFYKNKDNNFIKVESKNNYDNINTTQNKNVCPDCGADIVYTNGCVQCTECGWTKCN